MSINISKSGTPDIEKAANYLHRYRTLTSSNQKHPAETSHLPPLTDRSLVSTLFKMPNWGILRVEERFNGGAANYQNDVLVTASEAVSVHPISAGETTNYQPHLGFHLCHVSVFIKSAPQRQPPASFWLSLVSRGESLCLSSCSHLGLSDTTYQGKTSSTYRGESEF